jgi:acyl dehydratase
LSGVSWVSDWVTIDQERIDQFAACTGDHQWIHLNVERAMRESPFGTTIAHGYLTLATLAQTSFEVWIQPAGIKQASNYGIDRVRYIGAVKSAARIEGPRIANRWA